MFHQADLSQYKEALAVNGYVVIPSIVSDLKTIADYYRMESLTWKLGDGQVALRHGYGNESFGAKLHALLEPSIQTLAPVQRSYCYSSRYIHGAELTPHTDREQCYLNCSIAWEYSPNVPWPIWVHVNRKNVKLTANPGDMVIYSGTDIPHWREPFQGDYALVTFFHFVSRDFSGSLV